MNNRNLICLVEACKAFFAFSPKKQSLIFLFMFLQGATAGIGVLFIIPLLQIVGIDVTGSTQSNISSVANQIFQLFGVSPNLIIVLMSYILIVSTIASLHYILSIMKSEVQQGYIVYLRNKLYRSLLGSNWQFITEHKMVNFFQGLTVQIQSVGHASSLILSLISQSILTLVLIGLAFLLSWQMSLLVMGCLLLLLVALLPLNRTIYGSGKTQLLNFKVIFQMMSEQLSSLKMIKSFASETLFADKMHKVSLELENQNIKLARAQALTQWIYMVGAVVAFSLFFYTAQNLLTVPLSNTLLLLVVFSRLLPQISGLQKNYQQLLHKIPAFNDVNNIMNQCRLAQELTVKTKACPKLHQCIRLEKVTYCYPNRKIPVIHNLSVAINKNQTVALVGHSGAGKSTLADLIAGLIEPKSGSIYCDDTLLVGDVRLAWRKGIAYVTQDVYLFHDTIRANLTWISNEFISDEKLWQVLDMAAAADFVSQLVSGLETVIGDRGIRLSGGERQRLALARALLTKPQLLILDEATSALDHENERKIQLALEKLHGQLTIVIIAHRKTTIAHADKCIHLGEKNKNKTAKKEAV
ncbi:ABC transporter ATP-binding protein [Aliikangiella sp. IMCC44359]|uniref:ABC transporter ATP-binding protein n=1 Tax=Aliikangiella sp. IMCC44359 TaxID=3459125 RepID=UPI00403B2F30